jgi:hypothetical protein
MGQVVAGQVVAGQVAVVPQKYKSFLFFAFEFKWFLRG